MRKKRVLFIAFLVLLSLLYGCGQKADTWIYLYEMPEDFSLCLTVNVGVCQQLIYKNSDGTKCVILEAMENKPGDILANNISDIKVRNNKAKSYVYDGEEFTYNGLPIGAETGMHKPQSGDVIFEWKEKGLYIRMFGNLSQNDMLSFADQVRVRY